MPVQCLELYWHVTSRYASRRMGFFTKAKDMYNLQKQTKLVRSELKNIHVESQYDGVLATVNGEQEIISIDVGETEWQGFIQSPHGKKKLTEAVLKTVNKAMKKAQEIASTKMKGIWNELGVPQR